MTSIDQPRPATRYRKQVTGIQLGVAALVPLVASGCQADTDTTNQAPETHFVIGGDRPASLKVPSDHQSPLPLVLVLHGFTGNSGGTDRYFGISNRIDSDRIAVVLPDGTRNSEGQSFWNATDYCCNFQGSDVNDVEYLNGLVREASEHVAVDGVYIIGLSNGGFMAYRMACESMPGLRAIISVAGTSFTDPTRCDGARPVSVLHIHGTADEVIHYTGGRRSPGGVGYSSAEETVHRWATRAGCDTDAPEKLPTLDLVARLPGEETRVTSFGDGCGNDLKIELWTIDNGAHVPAFDPDSFGELVMSWVLG